MTITDEQYKYTCRFALPCNCHAPIAYTCTYQTTLSDDDIAVGTTLFSIDIDNDTITELYNDIPHGADTDDLNMICTKCGKSWVPFNPLFF